jgi:hypothetical protein
LSWTPTCQRRICTGNEIPLTEPRSTSTACSATQEETVFHESVHAVWDKTHARSAEWMDAQTKDGSFITDYARRNPKGEDLAESALFAFTLIHHPDRIPREAAAKIERAIPPKRISTIAEALINEPAE